MQGFWNSGGALNSASREADGPASCRRVKSLAWGGWSLFRRGSGLCRCWGRVRGLRGLFKRAGICRSVTDFMHFPKMYLTKLNEEESGCGEGNCEQPAVLRDPGRAAAGGRAVRTAGFSNPVCSRACSVKPTELRRTQRDSSEGEPRFVLGGQSEVRATAGKTESRTSRFESPRPNQREEAGEWDPGSLLRGLGPLHRDIQGQDTVEIINHCDSLKPFLCIAIQISTVVI